MRPKPCSAEFPELKIKLVVPDEKTKRHGQAVAAASLPPLASETTAVEPVKKQIAVGV